MAGLDLTILKIIFGTLLGAVIGAGITIWRTKYTVFSSDFSKRIEDACSLIDEMAECSSRIWANLDSSDPLKSNKHYVVGLKNRLSTQIHSLDEDYKEMKVKSVEQAFIEFSRVCTGGDFSSKDVAAEYQISAIQKNAELLKSSLYKVRHSKY
ncbi:hypothetical protein HJ118_23560 [Vibrio parahaemolyticus]|uniref:hypothetical protein n=1 Tax=Vibrio parahaemolyticus TaxID=670 RepID=UPI0004667173|nr:hypothetical protein [Vibrio parahaemolyticus]ELB2122330.1 hypothetical protein [Vibrio parahaemolyticus]MBE4066515.1 hypothetical protein [Vibrio parahaemolyticus]MDF4504760.1 hypothetical protein [Vibrio parahaemolyticus]MDG3429611.1 hypothetical protein [Vibrio parahaemolyticus]OUD66717.1 hypothetical protein BTN34_25100 [Vibrio parahaemolyticus]